MKLAVPESVTRGLASMALKTKKNSPHILFGAGVVGIIGSAVLACRATLKLEETLDEIRQDVDAVNDSPQPNDVEHKKELVAVGTKGAVAVVKLYAPSVVVGTISIALLTKSHIQLSQRNAALSAALTASIKSFDEYRARVREKIGEDEEEKLFWNTEEIETKLDNGKVQKETVVRPYGMSQFAVCFDETNRLWQPDPELNKIRVLAQQKFANDRLNAYGYVFLNDILDALGFDRTPIGQMVGWIKNPKNGDGYIDFHIFQARNRDFLDNLEPSIWLDFNVDGVILDDMP